MGIADLPRPVGYVLGGFLGPEATFANLADPPATLADVLFYTALVTMRAQPAYEAARSFLRDLDIAGPGLYGSP
jgi:hypothetical protein